MMFSKTKDGKYTERLNEDLGKILPKFKKNYQSIEKLTVDGGSESDAVYLALASTLDADYEKFNEYANWYARLYPKTAMKGPKKS